MSFYYFDMFQWETVCDKDFYATLALVLFNVGGLVGNYIFGCLQDRSVSVRSGGHTPRANNMVESHDLKTLTNMSIESGSITQREEQSQTGIRTGEKRRGGKFSQPHLIKTALGGVREREEEGAGACVTSRERGVGEGRVDRKHLSIKHYKSFFIGRRPAFFIYLLIECFFGVATAFAQDFITWTVFRVGVGFTVPAILGTPYVLESEHLSLQRKALIHTATHDTFVYE
uniref:(California timema) hypothetical protein n=1 Tax=Timema californicum TaxID=61474 RepID=A0A7R9P7V3_TIMCA|nr:unnamed protein product [Timema californicum]